MSFRQPYSSKRKNEGASTSGGQGSNQPADKRQRIQEKEDDWDEDDWDEFSQADMRDIDLMSSQALAETSKPVEQQPFVAPRSTLSLKKSTSSSLSSNGTDTAYPSSNESIRKYASSSASLSSSSSSNGQSSYRLSHSASLTGSYPRMAPGTEISDALRNELDKWKTDCERITEEKKSIENDLYIKDGEIKNLRSKLRQKDTELNNIRTENTAKVAEQKQLQGDKEKHLKLTNEKLETRLQFKEKEHLELEEKYRFLEHRLQLLSTSSPKKSSISPSKTRSPLVSKPPSIVVSPRPVKGQFPTGDSFRSDERPETSTPKPSSSATEETTIIREVGTEMSRRCVLNTNFSSGEVNGPRLVARLLDHNCNAAGEITDRGIVGLLHTPSVSSNLQSLHFDRDQSNLLLSPIKSRKMSGAHEQPKDIKPIVDKEHYNLAIHGLQTLLDSIDSIETESMTDITNTAAVLILPLLTDYFTHYISMLSSNQETNGLTSPTNSGSLKSSSCESSIESLTSSLGLLLKDGAMYAQNMEMLTSASLITLRHLVIYSAAVRETLYPKFDIVKKDKKTKSRSQKPLSEVESSGMETDVMSGSLFTSVSLSSTVQQQLQSSNLLNNIVKLATPSIENPIYNTSIVNLALDVLISFSRKTTTSQLDNLVPLTSVLSNCLQCDNHPVIVISAIDLFSCLSQSEKIRSSLTIQTVSCPLTSIYMLANKPFENATEEERRQIHIKIIMCMLNFTSCRNGVNQLVETICSCAQEFVRSMVLVIHKVMEDYLVHKDNCVISVLKQGLKLLHTIWFYDGDLLDKSYHYVNLIYSLYSIFKINTEQYENELCMLRQLEGNEEEEEEESMEADD
ncbi:hypothetical protein SNE40_015333 [Patella caerulea]|uniref:ATR-interacting protein n=1 Tax=Patella caerulea TaxID=87958 RepID=A0AAN8PEK4_PATCE